MEHERTEFFTPQQEGQSGRGKKTPVARRAALGVGAVAVAGAIGGAFLLGRSGDSEPEVAVPGTATTEEAAEPSPESTTGEVNKQAEEFVYPFEVKEYGGIPNDLNQEDFNAQMEIPSGLPVDNLGKTIIDRLNTALMYGAGPSMAEAYIENFTPDEAGLDWYDEYLGELAARNIEGLAVALYGKDWEVSNDRYNLVKELESDLTPVIVAALANHFTSVSSAETLEGHAEYVYQLDFVGVETEFELNGDTGFNLIATISDNREEMDSPGSYHPTTPEYPNPDNRRSYKVVTEEGGGSGENLRIEPNWDSGNPAYDSSNMTIPIPFI